MSCVASQSIGDEALGCCRSFFLPPKEQSFCNPVPSVEFRLPNRQKSKVCVPRCEGAVQDP